MDPSKPPQVRPSPHRFVLSGKSGVKKSVQTPSKPQYSSKSGVQPSPSPSSQFARVPRFNIAGTGSTRESQQTPTFGKTRFALTQTQAREDVEESGTPPDGDETRHQDEDPSAFLSIESGQIGPSKSPDYASHSPKRPRLGDSHDSIIRPMLQQTTPARFLPQQSELDSTFDDHTSNTARPAFLRSSIPSHHSAEPLPEAFSPHKRGQRFVPGGMAAELQSWVFEAANAAVQSRRDRAYLRGEDYTTTFKVNDVAGGDPVFVRGETTADATPLQAILVGERDRARTRRTTITVGSTVSIREPTWMVDVLGRQWIVGVDYKLIP